MQSQKIIYLGLREPELTHCAAVDRTHMNLKYFCKIVCLGKRVAAPNALRPNYSRN